MQPRASISSRRRPRPRLRHGRDPLALDQDVRLARAVGGDDEAAAHRDRGGHAVMPGTGWARSHASSASASPSLSNPGGSGWPIAASAAASASR